jgi:phosphoenolpyruvate-protein phosphotransferase (PTS system enzyme I)
LNKEIQIQGIAASDGIASGPAFFYTPLDLHIPDRECASLHVEMDRYASAVKQALLELKMFQERLAKQGLQEEAAIFAAHQLMVTDPALVKKVRENVEQHHIIEVAVQEAIRDFSNTLSGMGNELFAARAMDIRDVGKRLLRILLGMPDRTLGAIAVPSIIIAEDLSPSDTAGLDPDLTLGFCTVSGGITSHSAILARSLGIPAIVALGETAMQVITEESPVLMDGYEGMVVVSPTKSTLEKYQHLQQAHHQRKENISLSSSKPCSTKNGRKVDIGANIGDMASANEAIKNGAEGVGLLRTEFLYLEEIEPPTEDKQIHVYRDIFRTIGQKPIIVRTLDIGGDKPPSYLAFPKEQNPFLGWRAIRISLDRRDLFVTQLRSILQAAVGYNVKIMFPMVTSLEELQLGREIIRDVEHSLTKENLHFSRNMPVGIMIETPAAAMLADVLSKEADFFSIGTNDLTQYTLAVDRGNAIVSKLYQPLHPGVLRLIQHTIQLAHENGKWIGMCGELAGMAKAIPILLGFGLDEFSMSPHSIPEAKYVMQQFDDSQAQQIAEYALSCGTTMEIERYMKDIISEIP